MASSDDGAEQQLFAEILASAKKVRQPAYEPPSSSAIQSANLLNAARLNHRRTVVAAPSSSPSYTLHNMVQTTPTKANGMAHAGDGGKLKPVHFLREDLAKQPRREHARRGDPYELAFSSPEKPAASPPAKTRQKPRKKTKERVRHDVSPDFEAHVSEMEETTTDVPTAFPIVSITDGSHVEEAPETPPRASKRLPSESSKELEQQQHPSKRKAGPQAHRSGRPPKSPRKDAAEADTDNPNQSKIRKDSQRALSTGQTVVISTRAGKAHHAENDPPEHEHENEPPQSAQKPPEQDLELRKSQTSKRRKIKHLNPAKTTTGLDIASDDESYSAQTSRPTVQVPQDPLTVEREQRPRRKGRRPTSETVNDQAAVSTREQETGPREPGPRPRKPGPPKTSKSSGVAEVTAGQIDADNEGTAIRQTRSKTKTKPSEPVPVSTTQNGRSQHSTSQHDRSQKHRKEAQNAIEVEPDEEDVNEGNPDQTVTNVDDLAQSGNEDESGVEDGEEGVDVLDRVDGENGKDGEDAGDGDEGDEGEDGEDGEDDGDAGGNEESNHDRGAPLSDIGMVFKFLDSAEHSGDCKTEDALAIKQVCQTALEVLVDHESTLDEVSAMTKNIQLKLSKYGAGCDQKKRRSLKVDAYAYLFRQLVSYLESLCDWLSRKFRILESSLDAMRILTPLVHSIIFTKDRIADWKINTPSRYKGVRLIKDVDTDLIVPLRRLSEAYSTVLFDLKDEARKRRAQEELARNHREWQQNEEAKEEMKALRNARFNAWSDLHVSRLQMEPDRLLRGALFMNQEYFDKKVAHWADEETEGREERDANGVPFSRVDLFKKRVVPPVSPHSAAKEEEWTDEQMEALIDGLRWFAGPGVFQKIFEHYCGVHQLLRPFGVPEITAKAADVRVRLLRMYEEREWKEVPKWIRNIPILP